MKFPELYSHKLCRLYQRHAAKFTFRGRVKRDKTTTSAIDATGH